MPLEIGGASLSVSRLGPPTVRIDVSGGVPRVDVSFDVGVENMREDVDESAMLRKLTEGLSDLTARCQRLGVDPFGYGMRAAARFPTLAAWRAYDWRARFPEAAVSYRLSCRRINE